MKNMQLIQRQICKRNETKFILKANTYCITYKKFTKTILNGTELNKKLNYNIYFVDFSPL